MHTLSGLKSSPRLFHPPHPLSLHPGPGRPDLLRYIKRRSIADSAEGSAQRAAAPSPGARLVEGMGSPHPIMVPLLAPTAPRPAP